MFSTLVIQLPSHYGGGKFIKERSLCLITVALIVALNATLLVSMPIDLDILICID